MHHNQRPWSSAQRQQQSRPGQARRADGRQDSLTGASHRRRRRRPRRSGRRCRRPRGQSRPRCSRQPSRCCQWWWRTPGQPPSTERRRARPSGRRGAPPQGRRPPGTSSTERRTASVSGEGSEDRTGPRGGSRTPVPSREGLGTVGGNSGCFASSRSARLHKHPPRCVYITIRITPRLCVYHNTYRPL